MDDDLDAYLNALPDKIAEQLSPVIREQAELLSSAQRQALQSLEQAPEETGALEDSCVVVPGKNDLEFLVQAGGDLTTKFYDRGTDYERAVVIDGSSNEGVAKLPKGEGEGVGYDYALGFEFGTSKQPARPFFYSTYHAMKDDMQDAINDAVSEILK